MFTKLSYVQGIQHSLAEAGFVGYNSADEAGFYAQKVAEALVADPAEVEFDLHQVAEIADAFINLKSAGVLPTQPTEQVYDEAAAVERLQSAIGKIANIAPSGADGGGSDTNANAGYSSAQGESSTPIGDHSSTGDEVERDGPDGSGAELAAPGAAGDGPTTNAMADYDVSANGDSSVPERQTVGDEMKAAAFWGPQIGTNVPDDIKIATIRQIVTLETPVEQRALVDYVNDTYGQKQASDQDILAAFTDAAK